MLKNVLVRIVEHISYRLRDEELECRTIRVTLRTSDFVDKTKQLTLKSSTSSTSLIYSAALNIFNKMYNKEEIRLVGVCLDNLSDANSKQLSFFDNIQEEKNRLKLDYVLDDINDKYGENIVKRARNLKKK